MAQLISSAYSKQSVATVNLLIDAKCGCDRNARMLDILLDEYFRMNDVWEQEMETSVIGRELGLGSLGTEADAILKKLSENITVLTLVERFVIEPVSDFSAK